jgi:hypothetical protein
MPGFKSGPELQSIGMAACHTWLIESLAGPRPGGPVQPWRSLRASPGYACIGHAHGVVIVQSPWMGRHGGALTDGPVVASRWQGVPQEHQWGPRVASSKAVEGGAHPNGGLSWRQWRSLRTAVFIGGERALVARSDGGAALQC